MNIHNFDNNLLVWWKYITLRKIYHFFKIKLTLWWKFLNSMQLHQCDENWSNLWICSIWWTLITPMKFIPFMKTHYFNERYPLWWKFITLMKIHCFGENSSLWWKLLNFMEICCSDEKGAFLWFFILKVWWSEMKYVG